MTRFIEFPQTPNLIGTYDSDSQVSFGQSRVLLVWDRIIFPNGKSIVLNISPAPIRKAMRGSRTVWTITGAVS